MLPEPLNELDFIKTWVLCILGGTLAGGVIGSILGAVVGAVCVAAGVPVENFRAPLQVVGGIVGLAMSYLVFRFLFMRFIVRKLSPAPTRMKAGNAA